MKLTGAMHLSGLMVLGLLTACGGGSSDTSSTSNTVNPGNPQAASEYIQIVGAGIKGPLAFADAKVFAVDPSLPGGYDDNSPIASAMTDQYAQIAGLSVPRKIKPPYVLTIGGPNAIDLNTGKPPVISTLVTVITEDMLKGNKSIYASPLTTLAFHMAKHAGHADTSPDEFAQQAMNAGTEVSRIFAIDQNQPIDVFRSPLVIEDKADTVAEQKEAVFHRAAVEAFAAKVHQLSASRGDGLHATYYNDVNLSQKALERVDATIDFEWARNAPVTAVGADNFSVRWSGLVQPEYSENYTFYTSTDDGVRLWVDGKLIVDHWSDQPATEYNATVPMTADNTYHIVMEYYDASLNAEAKLMWSSARQAKAVIAKKHLYSKTDPTQIDNLTADSIIDRVALDLQSDNLIDNAANGVEIGGIDPTVVGQDSMMLTIPNTTYLVEDIVALMDDERILIGTDDGPALLTAEIGFGSSSDPVVTDPVVTDPVVTDPVVTDPVVTDPVVTDPVVTDPVVTDPVVTDPVVTEPVVTPEPVIAFSTTNINFGTVAVGGISDPIALVLTNTGSVSLSISNINVSSEFSQTNDCNGIVPASDSCRINLTFTPVASGNVEGSLTVTGNAPNTPYNVNLLGVGANGSQPANSVLYVDFEHLALGLYKESDLRADFRVGQEGYNESVSGPNYGALDIVADPASTGRGQVMRVIHYAGHKGAGPDAGGFRFRADLPPANDYYLAYDYYIPSNWWNPQGAKIPGLINGTMLEASHATGTSTSPDDLQAFTALMTLYGDIAYGNGDGKLCAYYYDKDKTSGIDWADPVDPNHNSGANFYNLPKGEWVRIEQRVKLNTVNQKDGLLEIWVNGKKMSSEAHRWLADLSYPGNNYDNSSRKIDGIWMYDYYGGSSVELNAPPADQYAYYDNFVVSTSPITH